MAYEFIPIVDGDSLNAVGLETRFTAIESEINALNQEAVLPRSLDNQHVASQVLFSRTKSIPAGGGTHLYSNRDPGASATVTEDTSLGPTGWYIIREGGQTGAGGSSPGTGDKLAIYFGSAGSFTVGDTANGVGGILVMVNIQVTKLQFALAALNTTGGYRSPNRYGKFAIQVRGQPGSVWHHLSHTERFIETDTVDQTAATGIIPVRKDISIRALIPDSTFLGAIDAVRVVCCTRTGSLGHPNALTMTLQHCNLSVMIFHGHMRGY